MSFMSRDLHQTQNRIEALAAQFDVPEAVANAFVNGTTDDLGYEHLTFGTKYTVTEAIASNQGGALETGQKVTFLGRSTAHDDHTLALHFEGSDGKAIDLIFNADAPQEADAKRYFRNVETALRPVLIDLSKRGKQLTAARAILLHLRNTEAPK